MTRRKKDMGFFGECNDSSPMEIDSCGQELDHCNKSFSLPQDMYFTRKNDESLPMEIDSCGQELDIGNRSFSLPNCSNGWDQESRLCNRALSSSTPPKVPHWSLQRSISYEQCYLKEGCGISKSPYVSMCKVEQSFEYFSPTNWKKKRVVETVTFNQKPPCARKHLSNNEEQTKESSSSNSSNIFTRDSIKWDDDSNKTAPHLVKFLFFIVIPLIILYVGVVAFRNLALVSHQQLCEGHLDLLKIESALSQKIFGQNLAIKSFLNAVKGICIPNLNESPNETTMSVIFFLGSTGVGKSYLASLFTYFYPKHWTVQQLNAQVDMMDKESTDRVLEEVIKRLSHCGTNLIIIDDASDFVLSSSRTGGPDFVKKMFYANQNKGKRSLLILILNTNKEQNSPYEEILATRHTINSLKQRMGNLANIQTYFVEFLPLSNEHVVKCIKKSLEREGIHVLDLEITKLLEMNSAKHFPNGCKGISKYVHQMYSKESSEK